MSVMPPPKVFPGKRAPDRTPTSQKGEAPKIGYAIRNAIIQANTREDVLRFVTTYMESEVSNLFELTIPRAGLSDNPGFQLKLVPVGGFRNGMDHCFEILQASLKDGMLQEWQPFATIGIGVQCAGPMA